MKDKAGKTLKYVLSVCIAVLCVWLVADKVDWAEFLSGLKVTRWGYILLFVAASVLALVFRTFRWRSLLEPLGDPAGRLDIWDALNIGNLANVAIPGAGEFIRCGYVSNRKATYDKTLGTILMERIWDIFAIIVLLALALTLKRREIGAFLSENILEPLSARLSLWWVIIAVIALCCAAVWTVWRLRTRNGFCAKVAGIISGALQGFSSFFRMKHKLRFALYTAGVWTMYVLMSWFGLKAVPVLCGLTLADALFISAIGNLASVIPVPSGMGPYHYLIMVTLASLYGFPNETGILYAVLCHESHAVLIIILGAISYVRLTLSRRKTVQAGQETMKHED